MGEESGGAIGAKINRGGVVKWGRTEWLPKEFEAAETEVYPSFEDHKYRPSAGSKSFN